MPLTETGFVRRTYDDILSDKIAKARELFGEDIDTSEVSVLGKYIRINAYDQAITEEEAEQIYFAISPSTATGVPLDRACVFAGIQRNAATYAQYAVTLTGTAGATIPAGFLVATESGVNFYTLHDVTFDESGTATAIVECEQSGGVGNVSVGEINTIVNPSADVSAVNGSSLVSAGADIESDYELRERFNQAKEGLGSCNETAIIAALLRVPTVTHAGIIVDEENGSFQCYVNGGDEYHGDIAKAIFEKKAIGIKTTGQVAQEYTDEYGKTHTINFSHTSNIAVYVRVALTTDAEFEGDTSKQAIKSNLTSYINAVGIGNNLFLSSLYGQIHSVAGVKEVTALQLSTDGKAWGAENIGVSAYESCEFAQLEIDQNGTGYEVV